MQPKDRGYLWDMIAACNDILSFVEGITAEQFIGGKLVRFAVERQLIVVGEAASHVSETVRAANVKIEWRSIIGLRNILAHDYGEILVRRVWKVATDRIPELKSALEGILAEMPESNGDKNVE